MRREMNPDSPSVTTTGHIAATQLRRLENAFDKMSKKGRNLRKVQLQQWQSGPTVVMQETLNRKLGETAFMVESLVQSEDEVNDLFIRAAASHFAAGR